MSIKIGIVGWGEIAQEHAYHIKDAGADLRGSSDSVIDLIVDAEQGGYPDTDLPPPQPEDERIEYAGLIRNFIRAVEQDEWNPIETAEILQTHRELLLT
jgi:predicted dehydrogenase